MISDCHSLMGHLGIEKVYQKLREEFYWINMKSDVVSCLKKCEFCQAYKEKNTKNRAPLLLSKSSELFHRIAMDIAGPLPKGSHGNMYILAIIDYFSKFAVLVPLRNIDAKTIAEKLFSKWIHQILFTQIEAQLLNRNWYENCVST